MTHTNTNSTGDGMERVSVQEAATLLGISTEATRQRIKRGTLPTERDEDGNVFVLVERISDRTTDNGTHDGTDTNTDSTDGGTDDTERLIQFLYEQLEQAHARDRENRRIIAGLVQRVPELEAAPEPRYAPETTLEDADRSDVHPEAQESSQRRSWLYRFFIGPE
jgi:hypothetical protein